MNGLDVKEQRRQKLISKIREFRIVDDPFMTKVFENAPGCIELLLHIILDQPDLKVQKHSVQEGIKNLQGRSVRLDVYAEDSTGKKYDIEMQLADKGATPRRARYNLSLMDANSLMPEDNTDELPEAYVIFITENDVLGKGRPIYMVERTISDDCGRFDDGSHIIYVNGLYREDNSPLTKLVHDLFCPDPNKMNFK